jgi:predicted dithiol-disulfide oxidoreductase (DUF899 family)
MNLPPIVSADEWQAAHAALLAKEKEATRPRHALAAERRRLPRLRIDKDYVFDGPPMSTAGLPPAATAARWSSTRSATWRTSMPATPRSRSCREPRSPTSRRTGSAWLDDSVVLLRRERLQSRLRRHDRGRRDVRPLSVFLRAGDDVYRTHFTNRRGVEALGSVWTFLDLTPLGRQESWEDSPEGYPQTAPYEWWRRHDEYP